MVIPSNNDVTSSTTAHTRQKAGHVHNDATNQSATASSGSKQHTNEVKLSQEAQIFERLEPQIQQSEGVDTQKVDSIRQQIAEGSYEANSQRIAAALLTQEDLLS